MTLSAPNLSAVLAESKVTLPPPMTVTILPILIGVSYSGNLYAFMRLARVKNSLADKTPFKFIPGIFIITGNPAPTPKKKALYPCSFKSSIVRIFPMI